MTTYVAPAHKVLTELHQADPGIPAVTVGPDPSDGATVCGLPLLAAEFWLPIEKRPGDRECRACADPGSVQETAEEGLF